MQNLQQITINPQSTIKQCLKILGSHDELRILLVNDHNNKFLGIITDPDIRRGLIRGLELEDTIETIIQKNPIIAHINTPKEQIIELAAKYNIYQIPLIDDNKNIIKIEKVLQNFVNIHHSYIVIMAGGLGTRLKPLTDTCPKPMLKIGKKPILELILEKFKKQGFYNIILCTNYKSHMIENYFLDGKGFGLDIQYIKEPKRLGTAGCLSLLEEKVAIKQEEAFFVMNGDILCDLSFSEMLKFHKNNNSLATMGVREFYQQIPYGVIEEKDSKIYSITEKPKQKFLVNAGIYCLQPEVLKFIPKNQFFDMPDLFKIIYKENKAFAYEITDYWIDIGRHEELSRARLDIENGV